MKAIGVIKKVFVNKREPYGFLLLLSPTELRGQEVSFFCSDIRIPEHDRQYLRAGMQLSFEMIDKPIDNMKSPVDFKALKVGQLLGCLLVSSFLPFHQSSQNDFRAFLIPHE